MVGKTGSVPSQLGVDSYDAEVARGDLKAGNLQTNLPPPQAWSDAASYQEEEEGGQGGQEQDGDLLGTQE